MVSNEKLLGKYSKRLGSSGKNRNYYLRIVGDFLEFANGNFERETVLKFIDRLRRRNKYKGGSANLAFRVIRTLYSRNDMEWPFAQGEAPQIREDDIEAPALHPSRIAQMITTVKQIGTPQEQAFLALSTTYGLRRVEMVELSSKDIRIRDRTIHIATAKRGRERTHVIPMQIIPYLSNYDFDTPIKESQLFALWYRYESMVGLSHIRHVGFHSIRRTLDTLLAKKLSSTTVKSFLRHKQRTSSDMTYRYSAVRFVGGEDESVEVVGDALTTDKDVFAEGVHPFIQYW